MSAIDLDVNIRGVVDEGSFEIAGSKALEKIVPTTVNLSKSTKGSAESFKDLQKQFVRTQKQALTTSDGLASLGVDVRMLNKSTASANQTLFAFSDLVQDSTQFTQGFAQGMRAIGNNVGFTAELFANLRSRVQLNNQAIIAAGGSTKDLTSVTKELGRSLRGVGGALIAINTAFIIGQILADKQRREYKKLEERASATAEAISEVAQSFSELDSGVDDPFGLRKRQRAIASLEAQLVGFSEKEEIKNILADASKNFRKEIDDIRAAASLLRDVTEEDVMFYVKGLPYAFGRVGVGTRDLIKGVINLGKEFGKGVQAQADYIQSTQFTEEELAQMEERIRRVKAEQAAANREFSSQQGLDQAREKLAEYSGQLKEFIDDPIALIISKFPTASFEMSKFFGLISEETIVGFEALRELRIETEKLKMQQEAFTAFLAQKGNEGLAQYVNTMAEAESVMVKFNAESVFGSKSMNQSLKVFTNVREARQAVIDSIKAQIHETRNEIRVLEQTNSNLDEQFLEMQGLNAEYNTAISLLMKLTSVYDSLNDPIESANEKLEKMSHSFTPFLSNAQKVDFQTQLLISQVTELGRQAGLTDKQIKDLIEDIIQFQELSKISTGFDDLSKLAQAAGQLGEVFGASKEFRLAMAAVDGGAAIVSTLADPTLGFIGKLAGAATIAAQVARQIQQIKKVNIGSGGNVAKPSQNAQSQFTQAISFADPTPKESQSAKTDPDKASSSARAMQQPIVNTVILDRKGLAIATNRGQQELENNSVSL